MKALLFIWTLCCCLSANALQLIPFRSEDHKLKVHHMDSVLILADSAYVISGAHAQLINGKLAELHGAYDAHARLLDVNAVLLAKVMEIERLVLQLMQKMHEDQELMTVRVNALLAELDGHIWQLQATNAHLDEQNIALQHQLDAMEQTIRRLKRSIRSLWWRSALQKVLIGLVGFGVGVMVSN